MSRFGGEPASRNDEMERSVRELLDSLTSDGFTITEGSSEALALSGGRAILHRTGMVIRATNDRYQLLFDVASDAEPERWYLLSIVKAVLEQMPPADSPEPSAREVAAFVRERSAELQAFFSPERWVRSRVILHDREQAQTAFMVKLLRR